MDKGTIDLTEDAVKVDIKDKGQKPLTGLTGHKQKFTLKQAVELRERGMSYSEIGKILGVTKQAVAWKFKQYNYCPEEVKNFIENKSGLFANLQKNIVQSFTQEQIKKASMRDKVVSVAILEDKWRLENNLSTMNIATHTRIIEDSHKDAIYD